MIISTIPSQGTVCVDNSTLAQLNPLFYFKKAVPIVETNLSHDGWQFEKDLLMSNYGVYLGYAIGAVSKGIPQALSGAGTVTNGGDIYVTNKYVAIVYRAQSFFTIHIQEGAKYESGSLSAILPTAFAYTSAAQLAGSPCSSYSYVNGILYEEFAGAVGLISYPQFTKGVIVDGRLKAAYGIKTGTWNMDIAPTNMPGLRKCLLNKWRALPTPIEYGDNEGVYLGTANIDGLIKALQTGTSIAPFASQIQCYEAPASEALSNAGVCYFAVTPDPVVIEKHKGSIAGAGVKLDGKLEAAMRALCSAVDEAGVLEAFSNFDGVFVNSGTLQAILLEYEGKYAELKAQFARSAANDLLKARADVNEAITEFKKRELDIGKILDDNRLRGFIADLNFYVNTFIDISATELSAVLDMADKLISDSRFWAFPLSLASPEKIEAELEAKPLQEGETTDLRMFVDQTAIKSTLNTQFQLMCEKVKTEVDRIDKIFKFPEDIMEPNPGFSKQLQWSRSHRCHKDRTQKYNTLGNLVYDTMTKEEHLSYVQQGGWWLAREGELAFGNRTDSMARNSGIESVYLSNVGGKKQITMNVRTYYWGAVIRDMNPIASFTTAAKEMTQIIANKIGPVLRHTDSPAPTVTFMGTMNPIDEDGNLVRVLNPRTDSTWAPKSGSSEHGQTHRWGQAWCPGVRQAESYYYNSLAAVPVFRFQIKFDAADALSLELPFNQDTRVKSSAIDTFRSGINAALSHCQEKALSWLFVALDECGMLGDVRLFGKTGDTYLSTETLAACTDCQLANADELITLLRKLRDAKDLSENPREGNVLTITGHTDAYANITELINELEKFAERSEDKVWSWAGKSPIAKGTDWNLAGWYLKM
jgi:hypothetical protein